METLYNIWVETSEDYDAADMSGNGPWQQPWGGRACTLEECKKECKALHDEFYTGTFDPWNIDKPLNPEKNWLVVRCLEIGMQKRRCTAYGFDTRITDQEKTFVDLGECENPPFERFNVTFSDVKDSEIWKQLMGWAKLAGAGLGWSINQKNNNISEKDFDKIFNQT